MNSYRWPFGTQEIKSELQISGREKKIRVYRGKLLRLEFYYVFQCTNGYKANPDQVS
jgi:hypothetical protein